VQANRTAALEQVLSSLSTIARAVNQVRLHERLLDEAGIRLDRGGAALLAKLHDSGDAPLRVTALAERLGVDTPTVTRKVQQLERLGLVQRISDPDDGRAHRILLTDEGSSTLSRLMAVRRDWVLQLLDGWTDADRATFGALLERFSDRLAVELDGARGD
jgi:DNA-binding MarR family transcriptional regulator